MQTIKVKTIVEGHVEGQCVVSQEPISFLGGVDPEKGVISDVKHPLFNKSIKDKIFVFPEAIGSTVGSYVIFGMKVNGVAPRGLIAIRAETIVVAGAILADIPFVHNPSINILTKVKTGDIIEINTKKGEIIIKD